MRNLVDLKLRSPIALPDDEFVERRAALDREIESLRVRTAAAPLDASDVDDLLTDAFCLLERLPDVWRRLEPAGRIRFQRLLFPLGVSYSEEGFRAAGISLLLAKNSTVEAIESPLVDQRISSSNRWLEDLKALVGLGTGLRLDREVA